MCQRNLWALAQTSPYFHSKDNLKGIWAKAHFYCYFFIHGLKAVATEKNTLLQSLLSTA